MGTTAERRESHMALDGAKVHTALRVRGLSAAKFAVIAGVSANTLVRAMHGRPISSSSIRKIAAGLMREPVIEGIADLLPDRVA